MHSMLVSYSLRNARQARRCCASTTAPTASAFVDDIACELVVHRRLPVLASMAAIRPRPLAADDLRTSGRSAPDIRIPLAEREPGLGGCALPDLAGSSGGWASAGHGRRDRGRVD